MKHVYKTIFAVLVCAFFVLPLPAHASVSDDQGDAIMGHLDAIAGEDGADVGNYIDPRQGVAETIKILLTLVGTIFLLLLVYSGYLRVTAHGEEDRIKKSTNTAIGAVIGIGIVLVAYSVTLFIAANFQNVVTEEDIYTQPDEPFDFWGTVL